MGNNASTVVSVDSSEVKSTSNIDISYDYRFFFDTIDYIHTEYEKYVLPCRTPVNENDHRIIQEKYESLTIQQLCDIVQSSTNASSSIKCYCMDGIVLKWRECIQSLEKNQVNEGKECTNNAEMHPSTALMVNCIKFLLFDVNSVTVAESLYGMQFVWQLIFHHIWYYLPNDVKNEIQSYIFEKFQSMKCNPSHENMVFKLLSLNAKSNRSEINYQSLHKMHAFWTENEDETFLEENQNENKENGNQSIFKYLPIIAHYNKAIDIQVILSYVKYGPSKKHQWFAGMQAIENYPNIKFWSYMQEFFEKLYYHISMVNGETIPQEMVKEQKDDEYQYFDIATQMRFIQTFCSFSDCNLICNDTKIRVLVQANIHQLLDIPKSNTNQTMGYYQENISYILECLPIHSNMNTVFYRIWSEYKQHLSWLQLNMLFYNAWMDRKGFNLFLLATHERIGKHSLVRMLRSDDDIYLKKIWSFLYDPMLYLTVRELSDIDNIMWWSPIMASDPQIMDILGCIQNLFQMLHDFRHPERFKMYQHFKQKHNSSIVEKYITDKFDALLF